MVLLSGKSAKDTLESILDGKERNTDNYPEPYVAGYFQENDVWIAFDNTDKYCWVAEFETKVEAKRWTVAN